MLTRSRLALLSLSAFWLASVATAAEPEPDYAVVDPALKVVKLDSATTESFLSVRCDAAGRLFVGGREELFVYEPDDKLGFKPRQLLVRFPKDTWVNDIEVRGHDLYVTTVSALYIIPDGVVKREGLKPQRLVWGVPMGHVHQCLHALAWGPEGDLYFSMGDPAPYYGDFSRPDHWCHWTFFHKPEHQPDAPAREPWAKLPYTGVGGIFRVRPDGSRLQVVATGLRNACGLCFDHSWNLFSNDNDHESLPAEYVPGRLNHVTPHSYFSWPRGWMPSKTPDRADLLDTMTTELGRFVPVLQTYYDDRFLPEKYRNSLLVARWCTRAVNYYPLTPKGASFKVEEKPLLIGKNNARPVGVCVGRGGRVFVTISYMAHNDNSPIYKSDLVMITTNDDESPFKFVSADPLKADAEELVKQLANENWSQRATAHQELIRREADVAQPLFRALLGGTKLHERAKPHVGWIWASIPRSKDDGRSNVPEKLPQEDANLMLQQVRLVNEFGKNFDKATFYRQALSNAEPPIQLAALQGLFKFDGEPPDEIVTGPARDKDTYLRQAATMLLAEKARLNRLEELCQDKDTATRLAGVLAVGFRLTLPRTTEPIPENLPLVPWRNAEEAYVITYADGKEDLRKLGRVGLFTVAEHWKVGPHSDDQEKMFALLLARLKDDDEAVRLQAVHFLSLLNDPRSEPEVARVLKETDEKRLAIAPIKVINQAWLAGPFPDEGQGFARVHAPEQAAIDLSAEYAVGGRKLLWKEAKAQRLFDFSELFSPCDGCSFYAYCRLESGSRQKAQLLAGSDDGVKVWHNGKLVWTNDVSRAALPFQDVVPLQLEPGSNDLLIRVRNVSGSSGLYLHYRAHGSVTARLPEKLGLASLAERLKAGGKDVPAEFFTTDWSQAVKEGNAENGRKLFGALSCVKCHGITADAANTGGPSLADAGKRFTVPYLVESVLLPSKQISPIFKATEITTTKGQVLMGLAVAEDGEKIELLMQDATRKVIPKKEIDARRLLEASPMPQGVVKTPAELRDVLAYLLSEKPLPP